MLDEAHPLRAQCEAAAVAEGCTLHSLAVAPKLEALRRFTHHMWETRGLPTRAEAEAFKAAGYGDVHILEIILAMAVKTISNYANHVNHTELDAAFADFAVDKSVEPA